MNPISTLVLALTLSACGAVDRTQSSPVSDPEPSPAMHLGHFSISLAVKDLATSRTFYEKLGFVVTGGKAEQNWLILQNGDSTIGLFQGMFERNSLTFNPGWNARKERLDHFTDVREIQRHLKQQGLTLTTEADESTTGPAYVTLVDPDGNPVLIDQHVK